MDNHKYELMVLVKAQLPQDEKDTIFRQVADAVGKSGGKVINSQVWQEKQRLYYSIKKSREATFHLTKFEGPSDTVEKLRQIVRLNDGIMRYLLTKVEA